MDGKHCWETLSNTLPIYRGYSNIHIIERWIFYPSQYTPNIQGIFSHSYPTYNRKMDILQYEHLIERWIFTPSQLHFRYIQGYSNIYIIYSYNLYKVGYSHIKGKYPQCWGFESRPFWSYSDPLLSWPGSKIEIIKNINFKPLPYFSLINK